MPSSWAPFWARPRQRAHRPADKALQRRLGRVADPVSASGRKLAETFWGRAWCGNLERYHDYENRLPRGRTYLRQGAVLDLHVGEGRVTAVVLGSALYDVRIDIEPVAAAQVSALRKRCAGGLSSIVALLEGRIGDDVMAAVTERRTGLFPEPGQIRLSCSCPDWATMCKHVAAVLYGVGVRLDREPELLFTLRGVEASALVGTGAALAEVASHEEGRVLPAADLSAIFGVTIDDGPAPARHGRAVVRPEPEPWDLDEVATWTLAELAERGERSVAEIVAFASSPSRAAAHARSAAPRVGGRAPRPSKRSALEERVLHMLRDLGGHVAVADLHVRLGAPPMRLHAALQRLVDRGDVGSSGKGRSTRYFAC